METFPKYFSSRLVHLCERRRSKKTSEIYQLNIVRWPTKLSAFCWMIFRVIRFLFIVCYLFDFLSFRIFGMASSDCNHRSSIGVSVDHEPRAGQTKWNLRFILNAKNRIPRNIESVWMMACRGILVSAIINTHLKFRCIQPTNVSVRLLFNGVPYNKCRMRCDSECQHLQLDEEEKHQTNLWDVCKVGSEKHK